MQAHAKRRLAGDEMSLEEIEERVPLARLECVLTQLHEGARVRGNEGGWIHRGSPRVTRQSAPPYLSLPDMYGLSRIAASTKRLVQLLAARRARESVEAPVLRERASGANEARPGTARQRAADAHASHAHGFDLRHGECALAAD